MSIYRKFSEMEMTHAATGKVPSADSPEAENYLARLATSDANTSEAQALTQPELHPLQRARSFLMRGALEEADAILKNLAVEISAADPLALSEVCLEQGRLAVARGQWALAEQFCARGLASQPAGITQLTLRQVRAVALFELGELIAARRELGTASSLAKIFPHCGVALYVAATEIKVLIALGELQMAETCLNRAWQSLQAGQDLNVNHVLLFARMELEWRRQMRLPFAAHALTTWLLARASGDELYAGLAVIDLLTALAPEFHMPWMTELAGAYDRFERVREFKETLSATEASSTSALLLKSGSQSETLALTPGQAAAFTHLVIKSRHLTVQLESLETRAVEVTPQIDAVLTALNGGALTREEFFRRVWKQSKFVSHLHDSVIRSLLHRLRKSHGLFLVSANGKIDRPGLWICP